MHLVECTSFDSAKVVADVMTRIGADGGGGGVTVRGEGRYVSTVSLAVAILCSDHVHACRVGSWNATPSDPTQVHATNIVPSLSVVFFPADPRASTAVLPAPVPAPLPAAAAAFSPIYTPVKHLPSPLRGAHPSVGGELESPIFNRVA